MSYYKIIIAQNETDLKLQRVNDQFLILAFAQQGYKKRVLRKLNRCRMYLKAVTLANILDSIGDKICNLVLVGDKNR